MTKSNINVDSSVAIHEALRDLEAIAETLHALACGQSREFVTERMLYWLGDSINDYRRSIIEALDPDKGEDDDARKPDPAPQSEAA